MLNQTVLSKRTGDTVGDFSRLFVALFVNETRTSSTFVVNKLYINKYTAGCFDPRERKESLVCLGNNNYCIASPQQQTMQRDNALKIGSAAHSSLLRVNLLSLDKRIINAYPASPGIATSTTLLPHYLNISQPLGSPQA